MVSTAYTVEFSGTETRWIKGNAVLLELAIKMVLDLAILKGVMLY